MIIKTPDDKSGALKELETLAAKGYSQRGQIERVLREIRAGIKGEQEAAYLINFNYEKSQNTAIIHDLRLEIGGRVAQIDHLLLHRTLNIFVLETKHFHAGIKITEEGEFLRWNNYEKMFEGMASPLEQNVRHIAVLTDAFAKIEMPTRLGLRLTPTFQSYVLVSPHSRIDRPKKFDTSRIIKADMLEKMFEDRLEGASALGTLTNMSRLVASDTLKDIAKQLIRLHRPAKFDYAKRFGITESPAPAPAARPAPASMRPEPAKVATAKAPAAPVCRHCGAANIAIQHGRFGYYIKCLACDGNTPIKVGCGKGHEERIRKEGVKFYRECAACGASAIYFVNPIDLKQA